MKKLNLIEILKNVPEGIKLYSPIFGEVIFNGIDCNDEYPINVFTDSDDFRCPYESFTKEGHYYLNMPSSECTLFPSKDQRDWSKFNPIPDKALVWCWNNDDNFVRHLRFYDVKNNNTFSFFNGCRNTTKYDNYELYKGEYPQWAKDALCKLED